MKTNNQKSTRAGAPVAVVFCATAAAKSWGALLDKLVKKEILTAEEAKDLRQDAQKDFDKGYAARSGLGPWVTSLKFNGDFRARYDGAFQDQSNAGPGNATEDRHRFRYRVR